MEHICGSCSIEVLGDFTETRKGVLSVSLFLVFLLLWAIFDPVANFMAISALIFVPHLSFWSFPLEPSWWDFPPLGFPLKPPRPLPWWGW